MFQNNFKIALVALFGAAVLSGCATTGGSSSTTLDDDQVRTGQVADSTLEQSGADLGSEFDALDTVFYFDFDKAILRAESRTALAAHAQQLLRSPRQIRLLGHADERGSREYNMALGERRANSVKEFLVMQGVAANLIEVISYGEERPAVFASNEESWGLNRRVELK
mgnify:CR=1 FL=1